MNFNQKLKVALDVLTEDVHISAAIDEYFDRYNGRCDLIYNHLSSDLFPEYQPQLDDLRNRNPSMAPYLTAFNHLLRQVTSLNSPDNATSNDTMREIIAQLRQLADRITSELTSYSIERPPSDLDAMISGHRLFKPRQEVTRAINNRPGKPYLKLIEIIREWADYYTSILDFLVKM